MDFLAITTIKTYGGHNINDGTNYINNGIPVGSIVLAKGNEVASERAGNFPVDGGVRLNGRKLTLEIIIKGGSLSELTKWFDTSDQNTYQLVASDGSVDWYVYARPTDFSMKQVGVHDTASITLFMANPIWEAVTPSTDSWSITASGQTKALSVGGNKFARPIFVITPTSARGGGFGYKRFVAVANRTARIYKDAIDLIDGSWDTSALVSDTTVSNQINQVGGVTAAAGQTCPVDVAVGGGLPSSGVGYCGTEQFSFTITTGTMTWVTRGINGTTAATHADNAVITLSRVQADGDDVRVINDETTLEEYRWFGGGGFNSATTKVFVNSIMPPRLQGTVSGAISNVGAVATITLKSTAANLAMLKELAKVSYKFVAIDMGGGSCEVFKFTGVTPTTYKITGVTRAQKGTSNQSHSDAATIRHIHGYYIMYGNQNMDAPTTDDAFKPIFNLTSSTNSSHVYASFYDLLNPNRIGQWIPQPIKNVGQLSELYTATEDTFADEASVIGAAIKIYYVGTAPRAPTATMAWALYHPAGFTTLTWTGKKYRVSNSWPALAAMQRSNDGATFVTIANEATPASSGSYGALSSHSSVALGATYLYIRNIFAGTVAATAGNMAALEITDLTAVLDTANTPLINFAAQEVNNYMEFRITNTVGGTDQWWIEVSKQVALNDSITIDTNALEAYALDGSPVGIRLDDESRAEWAPLTPGVTNTLTYTETGVAGVTIVPTWSNRNL